MKKGYLSQKPEEGAGSKDCRKCDYLIEANLSLFQGFGGIKLDNGHLKRAVVGSSSTPVKRT